MNMTRKKLIGSFLIATLIATVGAVIVSAQEDTIGEAKGLSKQLWWERPMFGQTPFFSELTEEQQSEINQLREEMKSEGSTPEEIRTAIREKLESYGIEFPTLDERLDSEIEKTEQRLETLYRTKELRGEGKNWEEIKDTIQEEYELEPPMGNCHEQMFRDGFRHGPRPFEFNDEITEETQSGDSEL